MAEVVIVDIDTVGLTAPSILVLKAAVGYAQMQRDVQLHSIPMDIFCKYAGLPDLDCHEFLLLLQQARKALATVEIVDSVNPERDDLPYASWPVFNRLGLKNSSVMFEVCSLTSNELVLSALSSLSEK